MEPANILSPASNNRAGQVAALQAAYAKFQAKMQALRRTRLEKLKTIYHRLDAEKANRVLEELKK